MPGNSFHRARWIAAVWLVIGVGMIAAAFSWRTPNQQFVRMAAEKALLEKQHAPHQHLNLDSIPQYRPVWTNPLFIFGVGAVVLACIQWVVTRDVGRRELPNAPD
jgi:hypothetical protein